MFDPKSPFNDARLSELSQDPADHDHLDAWLAHLQGYEKIERGPYQSTHGMKHDGWSALHPKQTRRVAIPNYTGDWNILMQFLLETQTRIDAQGCIDMHNYEADDIILSGDLFTPARFNLSGPDSKNRWYAAWCSDADPLIEQRHFDPQVAIAAAIITALEGQRAAWIQPNPFEKSPFEKAHHTQRAEPTVLTWPKADS